MQPELINVDETSPWCPVNPYWPGLIPEQSPMKQIPLRECLVGNSGRDLGCEAKSMKSPTDVLLVEYFDDVHLVGNIHNALIIRRVRPNEL